MPLDKQETTVSLGCGTLIVIALIVAMFSSHAPPPSIEPQIGPLRAEIWALKKEVEQQSEAIRSLEKTVRESLPKTTPNDSPIRTHPANPVNPV